MSKLNISPCYASPFIEVVEVEVEIGFRESNSQQEPSPWEDM